MSICKGRWCPPKDVSEISSPRSLIQQNWMFHTGIDLKLLHITVWVCVCVWLQDGTSRTRSLEGAWRVEESRKERKGAERTISTTTNNNNTIKRHHGRLIDFILNSALCVPLNILDISMLMHVCVSNAAAVTLPLGWTGVTGFRKQVINRHVPCCGWHTKPINTLSVKVLNPWMSLTHDQPIKWQIHTATSAVVWAQTEIEKDWPAGSSVWVRIAH